MSNSRKTGARRLAQRADASLHPRFREILDQMPVLVWTTDHRLRCTSALGGAGLSSGITAKQLIGRTVRQLLHPNSEAAVTAHRGALKGNRHKYRSDFRGRVYEASVEPLLGANGKIVGVVGAAMDVTERHAAEIRADKHQRMFEAIAAKGWEGLALNNRSGVVLYCNLSAARILGRQIRHVLGKTADDLIVREDLDRAYRFMKELRGRPGRTLTIEVRARRPDGSIRWIEYTATNFLDDPDIGAVVAKFRDITEQKQSQRMIESLSERVLRLQQEEERRIARELHDSTSQCLTALMLNLGAVKARDEVPPEVRAQISESLELARQTANEIRTASYLLHPPTLADFGLVPALREYARGFARRSGIPVRFQGPPAGVERLKPYAEMAIFRIVQEALTNVHRHSASKRAEILVRKVADRLTVEINDSGKGMPKNVIASLRKGNASSSGVGVRGIRERALQLKGTLNIVDRRPGTALRIEIPLKPNAYESKAVQNKARAARHGT